MEEHSAQGNLRKRTSGHVVRKAQEKVLLAKDARTCMTCKIMQTTCARSVKKSYKIIRKTLYCVRLKTQVQHLHHKN